MLKRRRQLGLVNQHPGERLVLAVARVNPLERDELLETGITANLGEKDLGHAAVADPIQDDVWTEALSLGLAHCSARSVHPLPRSADRAVRTGSDLEAARGAV